MKFSRLILLLLILTVHQKSFSQSFFDQVYYSGRAGLVYSYFNNSQPLTGGKPGYVAGFSAEARSFQKLFFVVSANYFLEGGKYLKIDREMVNNYAFSRVTTNSINLHNLDFSITLKYYLLREKIALPYIFAGPSYTYNIEAERNYEGTVMLGNAFGTTGGYERVAKVYNQNIFYLNAGIGMEFYINSKSFYLDVGYRYGLSPVSSTYSFINQSRLLGDLYNDSFFLTIGYGF